MSLAKPTMGAPTLVKDNSSEQTVKTGARERKSKKKGSKTPYKKNEKVPDLRLSTTPAK